MSKSDMTEKPDPRKPDHLKPDPWRVPLAIAQIPDTGLHRDLRADEVVRQAIARKIEPIDDVRIDDTAGQDVKHDAGSAHDAQGAEGGDIDDIDGQGAPKKKTEHGGEAEEA